MADVPWPEGVPHDYDEMCRDYKGFVAECVAKYTTPLTDPLEFQHYVWEKIIHGRLLEKFVEDWNGTLAAFEVCGLLDLRWTTWRRRMARYYVGDLVNGERRKSGWMPALVSGTWCSKRATFRKVDVLELERRLNPTVPPFSPQRAFQAQLRRKLRNICCAYRRKHAALPLDLRV